jgi:hypothetical protein
MTWVVNGLAFLGALMIVMLFFAGLLEFAETRAKAKPRVVEIRVREEAECTQRGMLEAAIEERMSSIIESRPASTQILPPASAEELLDRRKQD